MSCPRGFRNSSHRIRPSRGYQPPPHSGSLTDGIFPKSKLKQVNGLRCTPPAPWALDGFLICLIMGQRCWNFVLVIIIGCYICYYIITGGYISIRMVLLTLLPKYGTAINKKTNIFMTFFSPIHEPKSRGEG